MLMSLVCLGITFPNVNACEIMLLFNTMLYMFAWWAIPRSSM